MQYRYLSELYVIVTDSPEYDVLKVNFINSLGACSYVLKDELYMYTVQCFTTVPHGTKYSRVQVSTLDHLYTSSNINHGICTDGPKTTETIKFSNLT